MKFGFINLCGAIAVAVMLIPNVVYALKYRDEKNLCTNKAMNVAEQIGRFGCIILCSSRISPISACISAKKRRGGRSPSPCCTRASSC